MALAAWSATITDEAGNAVPAAEIEVRHAVSGELVAALKADRDGSTPLDNPFTTEAEDNGLAQFFVAPGSYTVTATKNGASQTWTVDLVLHQEVQDTATDTTAGRLLAVGAFGLGATGDGTPEITDFTSSIVSGFYRFNGGTVTGGPPGISGQGIAIATKGKDGRTNILCMDGANDTGHILAYGSRNSDSGTIYWTPVYHTGNVVGAVSQASGLPTGGLVERGSNANGEYARFADGTQICMHTFSLDTILSAGAGTFADPYRTAPIGWTFPAAFIAAPAVSGIAESTNSADHLGRANYLRCGAASTTSVTACQAFRGSGSNFDMTIDASVMAMGRWF